MATRVSVKIDYLRKIYNKDITLKSWIENPDNVYVGRRGRVWINGDIYHYNGSEFQNDYKLTDYSIDDSLILYEATIRKKIEDGKVDLNSIRGKKLGCYCNINDRCHVDILLKILNE